ncbi:MAG: crAss001_48 related protein [Plesiomonas sp.]
MMSDYKQRVIDEAAQLEIKLAKLTAFMKTETFTTLSHEDQFDMGRQKAMMFGYLMCLKGRISRF